MSFSERNVKLNLKRQRKPALWRVGIISAFIIALSLFQYARQQKPFRHQTFALDTIVELEVWGAGGREAAEAAVAEIRRIEGLLSQYQPGSDLSLLARRGSATVAPQTLEVLGQALAMAKASAGAYDPTVGKLSRLWGEAREKQKLPRAEDVARARFEVGWQKVSIAPSGIVRIPVGMQLDLGGCAKGYAVDRALGVLKAHGVKRALVNAGGQVGLLGAAPKGAWKIGIKHPRKEGLLAVVQVRQGAVSTSGDYQRYFYAQGKRYHHLLDPLTGYPASKCQSATVIARTGILADLLSTACFLLGPEEGLPLVAKFKAQALVADSSGKIYATDGLSYALAKERD